MSHKVDSDLIPIYGESIRVAVVDDQTLMGEFLAESLESVGIQATLVFPSTTSELLDQLSAMSPDVVLLDLDLGRLGEATPLIGPICRSGVKVLMLTGTVDPLDHAACLEKGAVGVIAKDDSFASVCRAIRATAAGEPVCSDEARDDLLQQLRTRRAIRAKRMAPFETLTPREEDVLEGLCRGMSAATIAEDFCVSVATVRSHIRAVLRKLGASSQLEAVSLAAYVRWLDR